MSTSNTPGIPDGPGIFSPTAALMPGNTPSDQSRSWAGFVATSDCDPVFDKELVRRALVEDVGRGDITTEATIPAGRSGSAGIVTRESGVVAGLPVAAITFGLLDPLVVFEALVADGTPVAAGATLARVTGELRAILTAERTALNFLGRLSGIATLARACVAAIADTGATVVDTRKTSPGLRSLEKYAVRVGGARNHRAGLDDGILIKDNHIAAAGSIYEAVRKARSRSSHLLRLEVECDTEEQVQEAVECGVEVILLDNMSLDQLRQNVEWVRTHAPLTIIEASGNIGTSTERLAAVAATGVDLISLGALTHSAPNFDVSLELYPDVGPGPGEADKKTFLTR
jgi:nicotinate-nucleotide pyrophosphorylase (carboxylating)